jgi:hypothetical protein
MTKTCFNATGDAFLRLIYCVRKWFYFVHIYYKKISWLRFWRWVVLIAGSNPDGYNRGVIMETVTEEKTNA